MKKIFTLLAAVIAALTSFAQISETFGSTTEALTSRCWKLSSGGIYTFNKGTTSSPNWWLHVPSNGTFDISTPYLKFSGAVTLNFNFQIDKKLSHQTSRTIQIGTTDRNGVFTERITEIGASGDAHTTYATNVGFSVTDLTARLTIRVIGFRGSGQANLILDNINIEGAALQYAPNFCNSAPVALNDTYYPATQKQEVSGNVLNNDTDANEGENAVFATLVSAPADGIFTFNRNGTFSYTPPAGFAGGEVSFQYKATDNGYDTLQSNNIATVTLVYPENATILPVKLVKFAGKVQQEKAQLNWMVADNENASHFEIQHSSNGYEFATAALSFASTGSGAASYQFTYAFAGQKQYYRLKIWDKEGAFEYSNVVLLQSGAAPTQTLKLWQSASNRINLQFHTATEQQLQLVVLNMAGVVVHQQTIHSLAGNNAPSVALRQTLQPGVYLVQLSNTATAFHAKLLVP